MRALRQTGFALGLTLLVLVWAGPFFWMVLGSVKPPETIIAPGLVLRFSPTLEHYGAIFARHAFWTTMRAAASEVCVNLCSRHASPAA